MKSFYRSSQIDTACCMQMHDFLIIRKISPQKLSSLKSLKENPTKFSPVLSTAYYLNPRIISLTEACITSQPRRNGPRSTGLTFCKGIYEQSPAA